LGKINIVFATCLLCQFAPSKFLAINKKIWYVMGMRMVNRCVLLLLFLLVFTLSDSAQDRKNKHSPKCPIKCKFCDKVIDKALKFLSRNVGGFGYEGARAAVACLAFYARSKTKYAGQINQILSSLKSFAKRTIDVPTTLANWTLGFAGLAFGEAYLNGKKDEEAMRYIVKAIEDAVTKDGGWGHCKDNIGIDKYHKNYPMTLFFTTGLCAAALGLSNRLGVRVKKSIFDGALKLLESRSGGYPYSPKHSDTRVIGRTSICLVALHMLGANNKPAFKAAAGSIENNMNLIPEGHASSALHQCAAGMACYLIGKSAYLKYNKEFRDRIIATQQPDGSFKCICKGNVDPTSCSKKHGSAFITAMYCVALQAHKLKILNFKGKRKAIVPKLKWLRSLKKALRLADITGRPLLVYIPNTKLKGSKKIEIQRKLQSLDFVYMAYEMICTKIKPTSKEGRELIEKFGEPDKEIFLLFFSPDGQMVGKYCGKFDMNFVLDKIREVLDKYTRRASWLLYTKDAEKQKDKLILVAIYKTKIRKEGDRMFEDLDKKSVRMFENLYQVPIHGFANKYTFVKIMYHKACVLVDCPGCPLFYQFKIKSAPVLLILDPTKKGEQRLLKMTRNFNPKTLRNLLLAEYHKFKQSKK
jgi:hypothetical protein